MKVRSIAARAENIPLTEPYTIAFATIDSLTCVVVEVETDTGIRGIGTGTPFPALTGETAEECLGALSPARMEWLMGCDIRTLARLCRENAARSRTTPAAQAALDIALHDVFARAMSLPLADVLGRVYDSLPTSVTIGICSVDETAARGRDFVQRGFVCLKVKIGRSLEEDIERLARLRESLGSEITIRVDANQGYTIAEFDAFCRRTAALSIELIEQPTSVALLPSIRELSPSIRRNVAADESLMNAHDALSLVTPDPLTGIFNIKLMKCGGIYEARRIATIAELAGVGLMWGCMDESVVSISAALHTAFATPNTRYIDLDGSFDLAKDVARSGIILENGQLRTASAPGLGVEPWHD